MPAACWSSRFVCVFACNSLALIPFPAVHRARQVDRRLPVYHSIAILRVQNAHRLELVIRVNCRPASSVYPLVNEVCMCSMMVLLGPVGSPGPVWWGVVLLRQS